MLEKHFKTKDLPQATTKVAVAVSGGADSMCMALLLSKSYKKLTALIVDHGLRSESAKEAKLVKSRLEKLGIEVVILKWDGEKPQSNIHEHARKARYELLTEHCKKNKIKNLFLAHTKNDQAETVMLRIYRGSGIDGISAMREKTLKNGVIILRPLLDVTRAQIEAYLQSKKIKWIDDPSNYNTKYERVKVRKVINSLDDKEQWIDRLNLLANNAQRSSGFIKDMVKKEFSKIVRLDKLGYVEVAHAKFFCLHEEIALKILVKIFTIFNGATHQQRLKSLKSCYEAMLNKKDSTLAGVEIKYIKGSIYFIREVKAIKATEKWSNRFKLSNPKNYEIRPLTAAGWNQIKAQVIKKTWPHIKVVYALPAFFRNNHLVSCPLLGIEMLSS